MEILEKKMKRDKDLKNVRLHKLSEFKNTPTITFDYKEEHYAFVKSRKYNRYVLYKDVGRKFKGLGFFVKPNLKEIKQELINHKE